MEFNYREFLFDNGIVGTTIGTLLGFATKKVFDSFRTDILKPVLDILYGFLFDTLNVPNTELISVFIEYILILFIVYLLSRFILFPVLSKQINREEKHKENRAKHYQVIKDDIEDIKGLL